MTREHRRLALRLAVATLPDGQPIAITGGHDRVCTFDLCAGSIWRQISVGSHVEVVALVANGLVVVVARMGLIGLWNVLSGTK